MASLAKIGFTLFLWVIMAAEMEQTQHCGGQPPIPGLFTNSSGICYVQAAWFTGDCSPYSCATYVIISVKNKNYDGISTFKAIYKPFGEKTIKFALNQLNEDFSFNQPGVDAPFAQVLATKTTTTSPLTNPSGPQTVQSIVYKNDYGLVVFDCPWNKETMLIDAFICTFNKNATADQVTDLKDQAIELGIKADDLMKMKWAQCG